MSDARTGRTAHQRARPAAQDEVPRRHQGQPAGAARPGQRHAGAGARQDRHQHGRRQGHPAALAARGRRRRPHADRRPEADRDQGQDLHRRLQAPRGPGHRHQGHAPRRPHVGVPRPAHRRRHPPHPRLPRPPADVWDGRGNYTFGLNDQTVFPEIDYDKIDNPRGMDITIVTTATEDAAGKALLDAFGFPFRQADDPNAPRPSSAAAVVPAAARRK